MYFIERSLGISRNIQKLLILPESPCPFLVSNACSIYRYRPFVCRKNVTFDTSSRWCHAKVGANAPMPTLQLNSIEQILKASGHQKKQKPRPWACVVLIQQAAVGRIAPLSYSTKQYFILDDNKCASTLCPSRRH